MSKLIIIPDVHGRSFWRKAVEENPGEEFIFLGDYLDPYKQDGVTVDEAFVKYYESPENHWLNYLAGIAVVLKPDGTKVFYAVKGLDEGKMTIIE